MAERDPVYWHVDASVLRGKSVQSFLDKVGADARAKGVAALVHFPQGLYRFDSTVFLDRGDLSGYGSVSIQGAGALRTQFIANASAWPAPDATYTEGYPVLETRPYNQGVTTGNHSFRAWRQTVQGIGIQLTRVAPCIGFLHRLWRPDLQVSTSSWFEKGTFQFKDLWVRGYNDFAQLGIRLEGNVHNLVVEDCEFDAGIFDSNQVNLVDMIAIKVDDGINSYIDTNHAFQTVVQRVTTTPRLGGYVAVWRGRTIFAKFENINSGVGCMIKPVFDFVNCGGVHLSKLTTEGNAERPSIKLTNCRNMRFSEFALGTPDIIDSGNIHAQAIGNARGNGFEMYNCFGVHIHNWTIWPDTANWANRGVKRVTMDATTKGCVVDIPAGNSAEGLETIATVITDAGVNNWVRMTDVDTGTVESMYNQVPGAYPF